MQVSPLIHKTTTGGMVKKEFLVFLRVVWCVLLGFVIRGFMFVVHDLMTNITGNTGDNGEGNGKAYRFGRFGGNPCNGQIGNVRIFGHHGCIIFGPFVLLQIGRNDLNRGFLLLVSTTNRCRGGGCGICDGIRCGCGCCFEPVFKDGKRGWINGTGINSYK
eukprot:scaffold3281_cov55-Attheya_sp.AAC.6